MAARVLALLSVAIILLSIVVFCVETLPQFKRYKDLNDSSVHNSSIAPIVHLPAHQGNAGGGGGGGGAGGGYSHGNVNNNHHNQQQQQRPMRTLAEVDDSPQTGDELRLFCNQMSAILDLIGTKSCSDRLVQKSAFHLSTKSSHIWSSTLVRF